MALSEEKAKEIMDGIERRIRHAYNCGFNDGMHAMKNKYIKEISEKIEDILTAYIVYEEEQEKIPW